jgi:hypothetical protein
MKTTGFFQKNCTKMFFKISSNFKLHVRAPRLSVENHLVERHFAERVKNTWPKDIW